MSLKRKLPDYESPADVDNDAPPLKIQKSFAPVLVSAEVLLDRILDAIKDDSDRGYDVFVASTGTTRIKDVLLAANRPSVKPMIKSRNYFDLDTLKSIGGDLKLKVTALYICVVSSTIDEEFFRLYVGQAEVLRSRVDEHERKKHLGKSLHHFAWNQPGNEGVFGVLAHLPSDLDDLDMWLNIGEMWLSCLF